MKLDQYPDICIIILKQTGFPAKDLRELLLPFVLFKKQKSFVDIFCRARHTQSEIMVSKLTILLKEN